ncbi:MAG: DUF3592 domain-containing protein [Verrucomicrobia bacterium]|nr:DUF3592 domain-containing protein [Verrucomicrobiota bacterium]
MRVAWSRPGPLAAVTWLGAIFLGGWLFWCAVFQLTGVPTEAEILETHEERRSGRRGRKHTETYGVVRYVDQEGQVRKDKLRLYAGAAPGRKIAVRYLPSQPDTCRQDDFWGIWGLAVMFSGFFALTIGLIRIGERMRSANVRQRNTLRQPTE